MYKKTCLVVWSLMLSLLLGSIGCRSGNGGGAGDIQLVDVEEPEGKDAATEVVPKDKVVTACPLVGESLETGGCSTAGQTKDWVLCRDLKCVWNDFADQLCWVEVPKEVGTPCEEPTRCLHKCSEDIPISDDFDCGECDFWSPKRRIPADDADMYCIPTLPAARDEWEYDPGGIPDGAFSENPCMTKQCDGDFREADSPQSMDAGTPCDDGDGCTYNDQCLQGVCIGEPVDPNDDNPCTDDKCIATDIGFEVLNPPNPANDWDDGNACTTNSCGEDGTQLTEATLGPKISPCTTAECIDEDGEAVCTSTPLQDGAECTDGNPCTLQPDICLSGECKGILMECVSYGDCDTAYLLPVDEENCDCIHDLDPGYCQPWEEWEIAGNGCYKFGDMGPAGCYQCSPDGWEFQSKLSCNDGDACTGSDWCDPEESTCTGFSKFPPELLPCEEVVCLEGSPDVGKKPKAGWCVWEEGLCVEVGDTPEGQCQKCVAQYDNEIEIEGQWANVSDGSWCHDGNKCTHTDECADGKCTGISYACPVVEPCATYSCTGDYPDKCEGPTQIDPAYCLTKDGNNLDYCYAPGDLSPVNGCEICEWDGTPMNAAFVPALLGSPCEVDNCCQIDTKCDGNGQCSGSPVDCKKGNDCIKNAQCIPAKCVGANLPSAACEVEFKEPGALCTSACGGQGICANDFCNDPVCEFCKLKPAGTECNDGDACTTEDKCSEGECVGSAVCDDGNFCTDDLCDVGKCEGEPCDADKACTYVAILALEPCDDNNKCTFNDECVDGVCLGTLEPATCDDSNACTWDWCEPMSGDCIHDVMADGKVCNDGTVCTQGDVCESGVCVGELLNCSDDNECTDDGCDSVLGCQYLNNASPCDDGNACTDEICVSGDCLGTPKDCDDDDLCTEDSCDPKTGCQHKGCDDGDPCTNDSCGGNLIGCVFETLAPPGSDVPCYSYDCIPAGGGFSFELVPSPEGTACEDEQVCTVVDTCDGGGSCHGLGGCGRALEFDGAQVVTIPSLELGGTPIHLIANISPTISTSPLQTVVELVSETDSSGVALLILSSEPQEAGLPPTVAQGAVLVAHTLTQGGTTYYDTGVTIEFGKWIQISFSIDSEGQVFSSVMSLPPQYGYSAVKLLGSNNVPIQSWIGVGEYTAYLGGSIAQGAEVEDGYLGMMTGFFLFGEVVPKGPASFEPPNLWCLFVDEQIDYSPYGQPILIFGFNEPDGQLVYNHVLGGANAVLGLLDVFEDSDPTRLVPEEAFHEACLWQP